MGRPDASDGATHLTPRTPALPSPASRGGCPRKFWYNFPGFRLHQHPPQIVVPGLCPGIHGGRLGHCGVRRRRGWPGQARPRRKRLQPAIDTPPLLFLPLAGEGRVGDGPPSRLRVGAVFPNIAQFSQPCAIAVRRSTLISGTTGMRIVNTAPERSRRLRATIQPPKASTKPRQIARPSPVPARRRSCAWTR